MPVNFRVFLQEAERTRFKIACAKHRTTMSQKALELIGVWLRKKTKTSPASTFVLEIEAHSKDEELESTLSQNIELLDVTRLAIIREYRLWTI